MAVYGARWYGSRSLGDGSGKTTPVGGGTEYFLTGSITTTTEITASGYVFLYTLSGTITTTTEIAATGHSDTTLVGTITTTTHVSVEGRAVDGFGLADPNVRPPSEIIWLHDLLGNQIGAIGPYSMATAGVFGFEYEVRLQEREALRWSLKADDPKAALITQDSLVRWHNIWFKVFFAEPTAEGTETFINYEAEARWVELGDYAFDEDVNMEDRTPYSGLRSLLLGTSWTAVIPQPDTTDVFTLRAQPATVLALVREWAKITGYEIVFNTAERTVTFVDQQGVDRGIGFRYGRNLLSLRQRIERPKATHLVLLGSGEDLIAERTDYSWYTDQGLSLGEAQDLFTRTVRSTDTSFVTQAALDAEADRLMAELSQAFITFECNVVDLSRVTGQPENDFGVGDRTRVRHPDLSIDVYTRVVRIVRRLYAPWDNIVELSNLPVDISTGVQAPSVQSLGHDWELVKNDIPVAVTVSTTQRIVNFIEAEFIEGEAVFGYEIDGTASGSGTITFTFVDYDTGLPIEGDAVAPSPSRTFVAGIVHEVVSFALKEING